MKKAIIEYVQYYDLDGENKTIGGIQTYIMNLAELLSNSGFEVFIIQPAKKQFLIKENQYNIIGVECKSFNFSSMSKTLIKEAEHLFDVNNDLLIFGSSVLCRKTDFKKVISIQHGIYWDLPWIKNKRNLCDVFTVFLRSIQALKELRRGKNANTVVCVDYNYINWYRCQTVNRNINLCSIPNFVDIKGNVDKKNIDNNKIEILFARRLEELRGSKLIEGVMPEILDKYPNVYFTIAGTGTEENNLREQFNLFQERVKFTTYSAEESIHFHSNFDIALIPSIGSEGTSLSLLEAMWAGCAVICTNVGGMTNIVLDGFNGIMVSPDTKQLKNAIETLIKCKEKRIMFSNNAKKTIESSFSKEIWDQRWREVLKNF